MTAQHLQTFLDERLDALAESWTAEELELAKKVAADVANLTLRALAGDDVAAELDQAEAASRAVSAAGEITLANALVDGIGDFLETFVLDRL